MKNGDLSNELTKRVLVSIDTFRREALEESKVLWVFNVPKKTYTYDRAILSRFYLFADRSSNTLELVAFDMSPEDLDAVLAELDEYGTNPFRYGTAYKSVDHLVAELPYRPEVVGVIDLPDRQLRYGHWGMDMR